MLSRPLAGFRLRLAGVALGAALLALVPAFVATLLQVRDELYRRRVDDARAQLERAADSVQSCRDAACEAGALVASGARRVERCEAPLLRRGSRVVLCRPEAPGSALSLSIELAPVRDQLREAQARLLGVLFAGLLALAVLLAVLLDRGVVRRVAAVDAELERIADGDRLARPALLPEGGDALGRLGAAVNRLGDRLGEERERVRGQIVQLEGANAALREARRELERSEQLAGVGRLASGVAHELGNPVAAILGYAGLLQASPSPEAVRDYAGRLEREALRMDRILRDLLELARPRDLRLVPVAIGRAVELARMHAEPQTGGLRVETRGDEGLRVLADEHCLVQVFVNLFTNAAKAGARTVAVTARRAGAGASIEVEDDGGGFSPGALARVFEPFFTTAPPGKGTGLGLALCHANLERMGGGIQARSGAKGALFTLRLNAAESPPGMGTAVPES